MSNLISGARTTERRTRQLPGARSRPGPRNAGDRMGMAGPTGKLMLPGPWEGAGGNRAGVPAVPQVPCRAC